MQKTPSSNKIFAGIALITLMASGAYVWIETTKAKSDSISSALASVSSDTSNRITTLEAQITENPNNLDVAVSLSELYLQLIRETGDATLYKNIETVLERADAGSSTDARIIAKRAEVANGRHEFRKGLTFITEALAIDPNSAAYYGIKTDAEIELGLYDDARESLQQMVNLKPNFSSYTRVAYQRELNGDIEGALEALAVAIQAGSGFVENIAWAHVESGKLLFGVDTEEAKNHFTQALTLYPNYAPALEGLGKVAYRVGDTATALQKFIEAFDVLPIAHNATTLGDYYALEGDTTKAAQFYTLADLAYKDSQGVNVDLEYAQFLANYGDKAEALTRAKRAYEARPSLYGAQTYAWALYKNNNYAEAEAKINEALRLGEFDPVILTQASIIYGANNKKSEAENYAQKAKELSSYGTLKDMTVATN